MTRKELIENDEYIKATIECIVLSKRSVREMRKELSEFFIDYKNELIMLNSDKNPERGVATEDASSNVLD